MPLAVPVQQEVVRETSTPLFPKNWASHLLRGECQVVRIGKRSPKWWWLKDLEGKARESRTKEGPRTGVRTSGKTNTPGRPNLHKTGPGTETCKKRSQSPLLPFLLPLSPPRDGAIFSSHVWINVPSRLKDGFSCYYLNKQSCNTDLFKSYNTVRPPRAGTRQGVFNVCHSKFLL